MGRAHPSARGGTSIVRASSWTYWCVPASMDKETTHISKASRRVYPASPGQHRRIYPVKPLPRPVKVARPS